MRRYSKATSLFFGVSVILLILAFIVQLTGGCRGEVFGISYSLQRPNPIFGGIIIFAAILSFLSKNFRSDTLNITDKLFSRTYLAHSFWYSLLFLGLFTLAMELFAKQGSIFDLNREDAIGTYFHAFLLFLVGFLAISRSQVTKNKPFRWYVFGGLFWAMAIDELTSIHESIPRRLSLGQSSNEICGLVSWTVLLAPVILFVALYFFFISYRLGKKSRVFIILAIACYLTAVSLEQLILGSHIPTAECLAEEGIEMLGTSSFIIALALAHKHPDRVFKLPFNTKKHRTIR
ncbi:hypothetical protein KAH81_06400 [bacterium]|nr:hypothetical protein [bacterium]